MADRDPAPSALYEAAREQIRHEDGLVNHRVTWLLVSQAFLVSAFASGARLYATFPSEWPWITGGLLVVAALGSVFSLAAFYTIDFAFDQMREVEEWWKKQNLVAHFPRLHGGPGRRRVFSTRNTPLFLIVAWIVLVLMLLLGVSRS
jgi:hypothetical protein